MAPASAAVQDVDERAYWAKVKLREDCGSGALLHGANGHSQGTATQSGLWSGTSDWLYTCKNKSLEQQA
jgi:hypothetical protein